MKHMHILLACSTLLIGVHGGPPDAHAQGVPPEVLAYPQVIFHNGAVLTVDTDQGDFTIAQAVAVRDGKILAVGTDQHVLRLAGPATKKVDLQKKALMPGVIDTHIHPNRYAISKFFKDLAPEYQRMLRASGRIDKWKDTKEAVLADIAAIVNKADPGMEWITINSSDTDFSKVTFTLTKEDLDAIAPDKPLIIDMGEWRSIVNSKGLNALLKMYGPDVPGVFKDAAGKPTGQLGVATFMINSDILPTPPAEALAPLFARELKERWATLGTTTISTRLEATHIRAYALLDVRGEMPLRMAYGHESGRNNPLFQRDLQRNIHTVIGYGSDMFWMSAITVQPPDGSPGAYDVCSNYRKRNPVATDQFRDGLCIWEETGGDMTRDTVDRIVREGFRIANIHTYGEKGNLAMVNHYEKAGVKPSMRYGLDHSALFNEELIKKSAKMGIYWSVAAQKFVSDPKDLAAVYGVEETNRWAFPLKELVNAGAKITYESSARSGDTGPFADMEMWVTRRSGDGKVYGDRHALDRKTVMRMLTRWGAEYVMRDKVIGTIEPGKYADLIVVDRNPLDTAVPDDQLSDLKVLMTMVGGKVVFTAPGFSLGS